MKFSLFYHSLVSDWNHGNAHFLRGIVSELLALGHQVEVFEPADGWSRQQLLQQQGPQALEDFRHVYPQLGSTLYDRTLDMDRIAAESDVIIVHEWNEAWLVNGFGELRQQGVGDFRLLFHDTHHRAVSDPAWLRRFGLDCYDGVLAFGEVLSDVYRRHGWHSNVWTWHEAADTRVFYPRREVSEPAGELVWIGNFGDEERRRELNSFLIRPAAALKLDCTVFGVRYPDDVLQQLQAHGINYRGWLPNFRVPEVFGRHRVTVHVPRRFYAEALPGIPTIRPFEALACGIPMISAPWQDSEGLFKPGEDFLLARDGAEMRKQLRAILNEPDQARELAARGLRSILERHTCAHRVGQLLQILDTLNTIGDTIADTIGCETSTYKKDSRELRHA